MKHVRNVILPVLVVGLAFAGAIVIAWAQEGTSRLPGINAPDEHPNGCVDCHAEGGAEGALPMNVALEEMKHSDISAIVKTLPQDCSICHIPETPIGAINLQTHSVHYQNPSENNFVQNYSGQCLSCHALNVETGVLSIKQGPKNW